MSYSDYGGYAYKNGELRLDHCDVCLYQESNPDPSQHYPMFFGKEREFPNAHVSLGDMEMRVMLYKQSWFEIWFDGKELNKFDLLSEQSKQEVPDYKTDYTSDSGEPYFSDEAFKDSKKPAIFEYKGFKLEMLWEITDNHYQYARLTQPDGSIWTGFSGYGVGAGLEDSDVHGFNTGLNVERLKKLFN